MRRTQARRTQARRTQMTFHLPPYLAEHIRAEAARLGVSQSDFVTRLLQRALEEETATSIYERVATGVEAAVAQGIRSMAGRVAYLTSVAALEAAQARALAGGILAQQVGREKAQALMDEARARVARKIRDKMDEHLRSLLPLEDKGGE